MTVHRRILVQLGSLELGGAQINAVQLTAAVAQHGYDSLLVGPRQTCPRTGPSLLNVATDYGVRLEAYDRPASLVGHARALSGLARTWNADLVHAFSASERAAYWGPGLFGRRALVRTIYEMSFDPRTHPSVPVVIGTGYLRDELSGHRGGATLISPPVDTTRDAPGVTDQDEFRRGLGIGPDSIMLVVVSRLSEEMKAHGIEDAINAVARLSDPRVRLLIVGTGDAEGRLRACAASVNARLGEESVVFAGPLSDPRPAYDAADVVLGMGSSAARGLAFGKPLVVLGERGWSAVFREPATDAIFRNSFWSPNEVADGVGLLTGHLRALIDAPSERARLSGSAREFAEANFGLPAMASRLAEVYENALHSTSARAWVGDLHMEARILAAKLERTADAASGGRLKRGRQRAMLTWEQRRHDETPRLREGSSK